MVNDSKITFHSSYIPELDSGEYTFRASQLIMHHESEEFKSNETKVYIAGPKFTLEPEMIHHVYPAPGIHGDFMADVPSIVFNRLSLPWERKRQNFAEPGDSWLVLFMVDENEKKELIEGTGTGKSMFGVVDDRYKDAQVNFLEIPGTLMPLFPMQEEYQYLSYCRTLAPDEGAEVDAKHEKSVLLCNRLPKPGTSNTVYLLSLEHSSRDQNKTKYAYLHKWAFYCADNASYFIPEDSKLEKYETLRGITGILFQNSEEFDKKLVDLGIDADNSKVIKAKYRIKSGSFHDLLQKLPGKLSSFNYPVQEDNTKTIDDGLRSFLNQGGLILKQSNGYKGYRGPLQAAPVTIRSTYDISELNWLGVEKYSGGLNSFDCSYRVAYEFGILTALQDEAFHTAFFGWKQEVSTALLMSNNDADGGRSTNHIFQKTLKLNAEKPIPAVVRLKVEGWKMLRGIAYAYLIPSGKMLPIESIRYFCLDTNWINAFLLGAFSVGDTYDSVDAELLTRYTSEGLFLDVKRFGFFIHSRAVGGWPDYEVDAKCKNDNAPNRLERKKIAKNIEMFLYDGGKEESGRIEKLAVHLPAGKTHSGFRYEGERFEKQFRKPGETADTTIIVKFHDDAKRTINISYLIDKADGKKTSANFGMMMLEGTPKVVFDLTKSL